MSRGEACGEGFRLGYPRAWLPTIKPGRVARVYAFDPQGVCCYYLLVMRITPCFACLATFALSTIGCAADETTGTDGERGSGSPRGLTVGTTEGPVEGVEDDGVYVFRGVPYAAPPIGDLRWKPPGAAIPRDEVFLADEFGHACVQILPFLGATGDEDCLVLNIATPSSGNDLPVLFWIHGGGFALGEGAQADGGTLGDEIARETGSVVVSINYRLGPFGFLAHSTLREESPDDASGNYGLMDQTAALEWARDNIAGFGGDPNNVTIFGESAGAFSVCSHLTSAMSAGLFHKAIAQSGNCFRPWPSAAGAEAHGDTFAEKIGCAEEDDVLACMRGKSDTEVLEAFPSGPSFGFADLEGTGATWWPILDGLFFTVQSAESIASGNFNKVPTIVGFTKDEAQLFTWLTEVDAENPIPITDDNYDDFLSRLLGGDADLVAQARAQYPPESHAAPAQALGAFTTDTTFRCPARDEAALLAEHVTTYLYQFEYTGAGYQLDALHMRPDYGLGAFHSGDIQYVFGVPASLLASEFTPGVHEDLWRTMMGYWARFAATGDPNGDEAPNWPEWNQDDDEYLAFDATTASSTGAGATECEFWKDKDYLFSQF